MNDIINVDRSHVSPRLKDVILTWLLSHDNTDIRSPHFLYASEQSFSCDFYSIIGTWSCFDMTQSVQKTGQINLSPACN